jgi:histidinol dehydrogenase
MRGALLEDALPRAAEIVGDVRARGDAALLEWSEKLDGGRPGAIRVPHDAIAAATLDAASTEALRRLAAAVYEFNAAQRPEDTAVEAFPGIRAERRFVPLDSVGVYVPGGRAPLVSSLLMAAVPARVAGVARVAVATPNPPDALLAAARELELDEIYAIGGAQAIAALAYGTETVAPVDKIVGPGNRWVTAAKLLVSTQVAIDLPAGPSEVLVVADESADPVLCAADLLAQAEHGSDSEVILVTTSERVAEGVRALTGERAQIEVVATLGEALARANEYAPEHLQLLVADPEAALADVRNAGTVFVGPAASAVVGDYAAGATHILPTGGLARGAGGLGLDAFLKPVQVVRVSPDGLAGVRDLVSALAGLEGLPQHAAAIEARFAGVA